MRRTAVLLCLLTALAVAGCGGQDGSSQASCVAPTLTVAKPTVSAGSSVQVRGSYFVSDCHDVLVSGQSPEPNRPLGVLDLMWTDSASSTQRLATVRADAHGSLEALVRIPADAPRGTGQLFVQGYSAPVRLQIAG